MLMDQGERTGCRNRFRLEVVEIIGEEWGAESGLHQGRDVVITTRVPGGTEGGREDG